MGYPWPKAPLADGTGTTSADLQRIIGSQYVSSGILQNGGLTVEGTSSMAYKVNSGACFMWVSWASRRGMLVPVDETTVNTEPAPSTGSRTDTVYVDGDGAVRVTQGTSVPSGVAVARFNVPAGITATTSASQSLDRNFAIAAGASLGRLHSYHDPITSPIPTGAATKGSGRFYLPSDRMVEITATHSGAAIEGGSNPWRRLRWRVYVDGNLETIFFTNSYSPSMYTATDTYSHRMMLSEGSHTVHYVQDIPWGGAFYSYKYNGWPGQRFEVWDMGGAR